MPYLTPVRAHGHVPAPRPIIALRRFLTPVREAGGAGHWVTIGGSEDEEGGGVHIFIGGSGTITKGPSSLVGKHIGAVASHPSAKPVKHHPEGHVPEGAKAHPSYTEKTAEAAQPEGAAQDTPKSKGKPYARLHGADQGDRGSRKTQVGEAIQKARDEAKAAADPATKLADAAVAHQQAQTALAQHRARADKYANPYAPHLSPPVDDDTDRRLAETATRAEVAHQAAQQTYATPAPKPSYQDKTKSEYEAFLKKREAAQAEAKADTERRTQQKAADAAERTKAETTRTARLKAMSPGSAPAYVAPAPTEGGIQPNRARAVGQHDLFGGAHALPEQQDRRTEGQRQAQAGQMSMFKPGMGGEEQASRPIEDRSAIDAMKTKAAALGATARNLSDVPRFDPQEQWNGHHVRVSLPYEATDLRQHMKERGYKWDSLNKHWWRHFDTAKGAGDEMTALHRKHGLALHAGSASEAAQHAAAYDLPTPLPLASWGRDGRWESSSGHWKAEAAGERNGHLQMGVLTHVHPDLRKRERLD